MRSEFDQILKELAQYIIFGEENTKNTYKKEKITYFDQDTSNLSDKNKIYTKFSQIEKRNYWKMSEDEIFYRQAKYLENFEDNYNPKNIHRDSYEIFDLDYTYSEFSFMDFRTYFSWRTRIRKRRV